MIEKKEPSAGHNLPEASVQARRFSVARRAQSLALLEDYVELIADLIATRGEARVIDIARHLGVSHPTAAKSITRLKRAGLATSQRYRGIFLTPSGLEMAERTRTRHRLLVKVLERLGVPTAIAEVDAEGMEHYVSATTERAFADFIRTQECSTPK